MLRISVGLASIVLSVLFAAHGLGLLPDRQGAVDEGRRQFAGAAALGCSAATRDGDPAELRSALAALIMRNPDVVAAVIRAGDGRPLIELTPTGGSPTGIPLRVPLALPGQPGVSLELQFRAEEGHGLWALLGGSLGALVTFVTLATFLGTHLYLRTVLRHAQGEAKVVPDRVRATLNTIAQGVLVLDKHQRIALANDAFARMVGTDAGRLTGRSASDLEWKAGGLLPWVEAMSRGRAEMGVLVTLDGTPSGERRLSVNSAPIVADDGACRGALATFSDLTPVENKNAALLRTLERLNTSRAKIRAQKRDLRKAKDVAEAASRAKGEFLANVSHEIRTPMNAIIGMTDITLDMELPAEQREYLELVRASADSLLTLIDDLLDLSKIEAGRFTLEPIPFRLRESLEDATRLLAVRAHARQLELLCEVRADVPDALVGDPHRLRQVLINLVGNAIKFTEHGHVAVRVAIEQAGPDAVEVRFSISDTGIGIPADKLAEIFQPFVQADGSTTRKYGGTGLGLAICTNLVELMDGRIWVESEPGAGSTFHFTARFGLGTTAEGPAAGEQELAPLRGLEVLVVDDHADSRRIVAEHLSGLGFQPVTVGGAAEAVAELDRATAAGSPYALALVDTVLPDGDGFDVLARGAALPLPPAVVLLLASADRKTELARCRQAGVRAHVPKPASRRQLVAAILKAVSGTEPAAEAGAEPRTSAPMATGLRVLLVEDNPFNQQVSTIKLERRGYQVRLAACGREALEAHAAEAFDLVLTDMQMPDMDGVEVARVIREREQASGRRVPIIAMTAHTTNEVRQRCLAAGMDDFVSKPIKDAELWRAVDAACPASALPPAEAPADEDAADAVLARVGGNKEMLRELLDVFRSDCAGLLPELAEAARARDGARLTAAAHTLKGLVAFFEAPAGVAAAVELEAVGRAGNFDAAPPAVATLERETRRIQEVFGLLARDARPVVHAEG